MSEEVLRFYQRGARGGRGLSLRPRRPPYIRYTLLALMIGLPLAAWWLTRDTWDMGSLIPKEQNYTLVIPRPIEGRQIIAHTPLWELLPEESGAREIHAGLQDDFGLPEWLVNNFAAGPVYISGGDFDAFKDAVLVTRMTRIGTLLLQFSEWSDAVVPDDAGGLKLLRVKDADILVAARGRVLLASRDRNALIRSLVLQEDEAIGEKHFQQTLSNLKDEMAELRVRPESWPMAAPHVDAAEFHVWLTADSARAVLACRLTPDSRHFMEPLLAQAKPVELAPALPGSLRISADFGTPAPETWTRIAALAGTTIDPAAALTGLLAPEARPVAGAVMTSALGALGSSWTIAYRGTNLMAFVPTPRLAGLFSCDAAWARSLTRDFPAPPETVGAWESWPRLSEDKSYVQLPLPGGLDLTPLIAPFGGKLLVATALPDGQELLTSSPALPATGEKGNLLIEAEPAPLLQDVLDVGVQLSELGLIRGQDEASLRERFAPWQTRAALLNRARLVASHDDGVVTLDLRLALQGAPATP